MSKPNRKEFVHAMMLHYLNRLDQEYDSCSDSEFNFLVAQFNKYEWEYIGFQVQALFNEVNQMYHARPVITTV